MHRNETENTREERYANAFGRAFLTPARGLMQKFHEVTAGSDRLTRRHVIILAHYCFPRHTEEMRQDNDNVVGVRLRPTS